MSTVKSDNIVYVSVTQGDTLRLSVDLNGSTGDVDITGWTWRATVRHPDGTTATPMTTEVTDAAAGILEISLSPEQTSGLGVADYDWDVEATDTFDDVRTLVVGRLRVREDVSP
jgi:hypothetical protein